MAIIRIIKTPADYKAALAEATRLAALDPSTGSPDSDRLELLGLLLEDYETKVAPSELPSPLEAILFRMDQLGLRQRDLVPYMGSRSKVSEVLSGKRPLTLAMIRSLHNGLGISATSLLQDRNSNELEVDETVWSRFPVREMARRGWITAEVSSVLDHAEELVKGFFAPIGGPRYAAALLRRTRSVRSTREMDPYSVSAWVARVMICASEHTLPGRFDSNEFTSEKLTELVKLSWSEHGPSLAREFLANNGIAMVVEPHLPRTHLDGAAILGPNNIPVIALTIRHDRLDNFWFTLLHELAHLVLHLAPAAGLPDGANQFLDDLDSESSDRHEGEADALAAEILLPSEAWAASPASKLRTPEAAISLANKLRIHPAIVAGRIRHESQGFQVLSKMVGRGEVRAHFPEGRWT